MKPRAAPPRVRHRARMARRGFVRVEVSVSKRDAPLEGIDLERARDLGTAARVLVGSL